MATPRSRVPVVGSPSLLHERRRDGGTTAIGSNNSNTAITVGNNIGTFTGPNNHIAFNGMNNIK
jgi:hypothetical protein